MNEAFTPAFVRSLRDEAEAFGGTLKEFCAHKNLNYTYASRKIHSLEKDEAEAQIALAKKKIAKLTPLAADKLNALLNDQESEIQIRAAIEILKRAGIGERQALVEFTQNNLTQNNTLIPVNITLPDNGRMIRVASEDAPDDSGQ